MAIGSSPTVGKTSQTCLQEFTIHFRRAEDRVFDGRYGFDWYRPEFFKKMTYYQPLTSSEERIKVALVTGNIDTLKSTYTHGQKTKILPYGKEYIPAWLAIYSTEWLNVHRSGQGENYSVALDLELNLIEDKNDGELNPIDKNKEFELKNNGTILKFEASNPNIVIDPSEMNINRFLSTFGNNKKLSNQENDQKYLVSNAVNISCKSALENHEEILVYAEKNGCKEVVGQLMLYHNAVIPTLKVIFVDVITNEEKPRRSYDYEDFLQNRSFNQALINVEIINAPAFDFRKYRKNDVDVNISLNKLNINNTSYFLDDLSKFYKKYQDKSLAAKNYVFVTNVFKEEGVGSGGDSVTLFKCPEDIFNQVVVHELGHRFGLIHLFDSQKINPQGKSFQFLPGLTGNFLDYDHRKIDEKEKNGKTKSRAIRNPTFSLSYFFKYQWDLLRKRVK